jgi:hypothetical protein
MPKILPQYIMNLGVYFGYPPCCIHWFIMNRSDSENLTPLTKQQEAVHGNEGFIPCPECASKVTAKTISTLIQNRKCKIPYPGNTAVTVAIAAYLTK